MKSGRLVSPDWVDLSRFQIEWSIEWAQEGKGEGPQIPVYGFQRWHLNQSQHTKYYQRGFFLKKLFEKGSSQSSDKYPRVNPIIPAKHLDMNV